MNATTTTSPSWELSRKVRATIICRDLPVTAETATDELIGRIASNLLRNGHADIAGYDISTVRTILLDENVTAPYPADAPAQYAGK